jgi:hypothetical protein
MAGFFVPKHSKILVASSLRHSIVLKQMRVLIVLLITFLQASIVSARTWKNAEGTQSFEATYISNDGKLVTLRRGGRILTFSIAKLHADDQAWLRTNHPPKPAGGSTPGAEPAPEGAAFDSLEFGDTRKEVIEKLGKSKIVESSVPEVMLARVGLNGTFKTKKTIGGLHCHLYFDWTDKGKLKEVTLRTKPQPGSSYSGLLQSNWGELIQLLTILHGKAVQGAPYPDSKDLQDGLILGSHLWHTEDGHSVLLGTGQEGRDYSIIVRITSERIKASPAQ